ncbi:hypothetical protein LA080_014436 [Diaporthe eres]|nr:hypothetical protein LA080_014436 [Diaporthe eres]
MASGADNRPRQPRVSQKKEGRHYARVNVLLLTFYHHDQGDDLDDETEHVKEAFERLNYTVSEEEIRMKHSLAELEVVLERFLPKEECKDTLFIIYYHGHGYLRPADDEFTIFSHNHPSSRDLQRQVTEFWDKIDNIFQENFRGSRSDAWEGYREEFGDLQDIAEIAWRDINRPIMASQCDTLVVLDCCNAGLASAMAQDGPDPEHNFRKELLGACTWGNETEDRMSQALCKVLSEIHQADGISTLVRKMNNILVRSFVANTRRTRDREQVVPQAVHYVLRRTAAERIILPRLRAPARRPLRRTHSAADIGDRRDTGDI